MNTLHVKRFGNTIFTYMIQESVDFVFLLARYVPQVNLLWHRAVCDEPDFKRVFCLVHAEKLLYQTADKALRSFKELIQAKRGMHCTLHIWVKT